MNDDEPTPRANWRRRGSIAAAVALVLASGGYGVYRLISGTSTPAKHNMEVVTLKLIQPPPPPPPPPPVQKPPPEPQKMIEQPKDTAPPVKPKTADNKPPSPAPKGNTPTGTPGNGGMQLGDNGGGGGQYQTRWGWYANLMQESIQQVLQKDDKLRSGRYAIVVAMSLSPTGQPGHVKLLKSTGNQEIDARIEQVLSDMPRLSEAPPSDMPQPVNLRIDARTTQ